VARGAGEGVVERLEHLLRVGAARHDERQTTPIEDALVERDDLRPCNGAQARGRPLYGAVGVGPEEHGAQETGGDDPAVGGVALVGVGVAVADPVEGLRVERGMQREVRR
jgi:hypothetical protein